MKIKLKDPYAKKYKAGYVVVNPENRRNLILVDNFGRLTTVSYARYLMAVKLGRFLTVDEFVDHKDEDKTNDTLRNLQILTRAENIAKQNRARAAARRL